MNSSTRQASALLSLSLFLALFAFSMHARAATVFSDSFDYSAWNSGEKPMTANWTTISGDGTTSIDSSNSSYPKLSTPYLRMGNRVVGSDLGQTLTENFTLTANVLPSEYSTSLWIGLVDDTGTKGYGFRWDTSTKATAGGNGSMQVTKFDAATPEAVIFNGLFSEKDDYTVGKLIGSIQRPGKNATELGAESEFMTISLSWESIANSLTLTINGTSFESIVDTSFSSFSKILIGATGPNHRIGDVSVTTSAAVPEPAHAALGFALFGCITTAIAITHRRYRSHKQTQASA